VNAKRFRPDVDAPEYKGPQRPYDILKEGTIALVVVALLTIVLAVVFGSPDQPAITIKKWSNAAPLDFAQDALSQLNQTSETATYGAPYNNASSGQQLGPIGLAKLVGVRIPINTVSAFVIDPLKSLPPAPPLSGALKEWASAASSQRTTWVNAYSKAATHMKIVDHEVAVPGSGYGPVPVFMDSLLSMARSGALDQALVTQNGFYTTNYTLPLLFLEDGSYLANQAAIQHLQGSQWGMMNETGNYPGQAWLWLYTFWYQVPPYNSSGNADVLVWGTMMLLTLGLLLVPFIPGIRSIPRKTKVYRLIWRDYYRNQT
jgi:hypothetical protein